MTTATTNRLADPRQAASSAPAPAMPRRAHRGIPATRLLALELRKMFDTRSGLWLMASIAITATLATGAVILWAPDEALTYESFATAIGAPMSVILPVIAVLSVTSEWSQRSGLTTFTLVPHRGRVVAAKAAAVLVVGVASMVLAMGIGALGNLLGTAITGTDLVWDASTGQLGTLVLANVLQMFLGFALGLVLRNSAAGIVAYFVLAFVLYPLSMLLAANAGWWRDAMPWLDFNDAQAVLFDGGLTGTDWAQLATASSLWILLPLVVGTVTTLRAEVK